MLQVGRPHRSALIGFADGCASPASRASSESEEMLAFAHIPIDIDELKGRVFAPVSALTAIGAVIKIGRATP